jgi:hypothetical protein
MSTNEQCDLQTGIDGTPAKRDIVMPNECRVMDKYAINQVDVRPRALDPGESVMREIGFDQVGFVASRPSHTALSHNHGVLENATFSHSNTSLDRPVSEHLVKLSVDHV